VTSAVPRERLDRIAFAAAVVANLVLLYAPRTVSPGGVPHLDKVAHLVAFAAVAWTGLRAGVPARLLLPLLVLHAVTSEVVQARWLGQRSGDWLDVLADLVGVLAGALLAQASWRYERAALRRGRRSHGPVAGRDPGAR
jgi:hypothetical protein